MMTLNTSRLAGVACLVTALAWMGSPLPCHAEDPLFTFMQFSDAQVGDPANKPIHTGLIAAVELANLLQPAFVVNSGDMVHHPVYEASPENLAEYAEYKSYIAELTVPIYHLPGNHEIGYSDPGDDTWGGGNPWGDYETLVAAYEAELGPLNHSITHQGFRFVFYNNNPKVSGGQSFVSPEVFDWVESELEEGDRTFLFTHVQLLERGTGPFWGASAQDQANLFEQHNVVGVGYGHYHELHVQVRNGIPYIMAPDIEAIDDGQQVVFQYRVFANHFELWGYDVFSQVGTQLSSFAMQPLIGDIAGSGLEGDQPDGIVNLLDWQKFQDSFGENLAGLTPLESYLLGDFNGDLKHTLADLQLFKAAFYAANNADLPESANTPEPSTCLLAHLALVGIALVRRRHGASPSKEPVSFSAVQKRRPRMRFSKGIAFHI